MAIKNRPVPFFFLEFSGNIRLLSVSLLKREDTQLLADREGQQLPDICSE